jgi:hypothetical protein
VHVEESGLIFKSLLFFVFHWCCGFLCFKIPNPCTHDNSAPSTTFNIFSILKKKILIDCNNYHNLGGCLVHGNGYLVHGKLNYVFEKSSKLFLKIKIFTCNLKK